VQVVHPDLADDFPRLRVHPEALTNLPVQLSSFVGRQREQSEVHALVDANRLVTLTGAGGAGKTRLAMRVAADRLDAHLDGVWLADVSRIKEAGLVPAAVAEAIGGRRVDDASTLAASIGDRQLLIVVDNCEHLIDACAALADEVLRRCPHVTVVATSREPLGVSGEVSYRIPSLSVPPDGWGGGLDELTQYEAIALFVERACRAKPVFSLDDESAPVVIDICRRLDGMPLAIELAAARARVMSLESLRDGLYDRFRLLTGGARTAVPRQQTLQASVDWSYALLLDVERALLRRLSVFAGSFPLDGAEQVGAGGGIDAHHVLDLLTHLVDKSLVTALDDGRFTLPETIRQYAAASLADVGEVDDAYGRLHAWASGVAAHHPGESVDQQFQRAARDFDNVRRALDWVSDRPDRGLLRDLALELEAFWLTGRRAREGADWLRRAWDRSERADVQVQVVLASALGLSNQSAAALPLAEDAVARLRGERAPVALARALVTCATAAANNGGDGLRFAEEALALATEAGHDRLRAWALFQIGFIELRDTGDLAKAGRVLDEAVAVAAACGPALDFRVNSLLNRDGPGHLRLRRLMSQAFTPKLVAELRQQVESLVDELIAPLLDGEACDVVDILAYPLPSIVICELLGLRGVDRSEVRATVVRLSDPDQAVINAAIVGLRDLMDAQLRTRRPDPSGDLLERLIAVEQGADALDHDEIVDNAVLLFFAGFETTRHLITSGCAALLDFPAERERLWSDPRLASSAVEEFLRYDGPVPFVASMATEPVEIGDRTIREGRVLYLLLGSANRDEAAFAKPDSLDITRAPNPHVAFGGGPHRCLGMHLARLEGEVVFRRLAERLPGLEPAGARVPKVGGLGTYEALPVQA